MITPTGVRKALRTKMTAQDRAPEGDRLPDMV
jgi:hypothetical protein